MKQTIKKLCIFIFGTDNNILFNVNCASFTTAILFFVLANITAKSNLNSSLIFSYISGICYAIWINIIQEFPTIQKFVAEFLRLIIFLLIFIFSLNACLQFSINYNSEPTFIIILSSIGLFLCLFYFFSKLTSIFNFMKKLLKQIKTKLYDSDNPAPSKAKAFIENVTAFLVSIGALTIAIKSIAESIIQTLEYFK